MSVTLQVNGQEMTFSEAELTAILEKHFSNETETTIVKLTPTEGEKFEVNPESIDQNLFKEKRNDSMQEDTRQIILEAFGQVRDEPEKYARAFKTLRPEKAWEIKTARELQEIARKFGDHMADWVEQALEWAQRISNGETWEAVCNRPDTANWYRLIIWKNGSARIVGGSSDSGNPASYVSKDNYANVFINTVPLVVSYE